VDEPTPIETVSSCACLECERVWVDDAEHWRAYLDEEGQLLLYCPACASREFDA
jgi:hypothetical protein